MAHVVKGGAGALGALLAAAWVSLLWPGAALALQSDLVPEGALSLTASLTHEPQTEAIGNDGHPHNLGFYLLRSASVRSQVAGSVERRVDTATLTLRWGLSDTWNLQAALPWVSIRQSSSLRTASADPEVQDVVGELGDATVSGLGDIKIAALYRPLFTDTDGIVLEMSLRYPGSRPEGLYLGRATLQVAAPAPAAGAAFHYTRYALAVDHGRFDLRAHFFYALDANVDTPTAKGAYLDGGRAAGITVSWGEERGPFGYRLYLAHESSTSTYVRGQNQEDLYKDTRAGAEFTMGNLNRLELGRTAFPYVMGLSLDNMVHGFNTPRTNRYSAFFESYF